jgi:hypothetical protein
VFLILQFSNVLKLCLFNNAFAKSSSRCRITYTGLERTCKVAPWSIECNYPAVTDSHEKPLSR